MHYDIGSVVTRLTRISFTGFQTMSKGYPGRSMATGKHRLLAPLDTRRSRITWVNGKYEVRICPDSAIVRFKERMRPQA